MAEVPSKQYFESKASETGFLASNLEKVYRLTEILKEIRSFDTESYLALRGGTAANFCFQNVPRLSIDIDLVYIKSFEKKLMELERPKIRTSLEQIFDFLGYRVEQKTSYAPDQYLLMYRNSASNIDRVKVEVNYVSSRVPILNVVRRKMTSLFDSNQQEVLVLAPEELYGSKVKALIERGIARDLFDIYQIAKNPGSTNLHILKRAAIFYCCLELHSDFRDRIKSELLNRIDEKTIRRELKPLLRKNVAFPLEDARRTVGDLMSKMLALDREEREFVDAFYRLDYRPELLFPSNPTLIYHPGAEFRLKALARERKSSKT